MSMETLKIPIKPYYTHVCMHIFYKVRIIFPVANKGRGCYNSFIT